ncbi:hypothetical protein QFW96_23325 [Saccharopolyspora sp. TS4A08]|uniref:Uncharacterized protein n=1 Tax=Saccharopolyspora ipomoeae TaxID=3042027 RepID=A0ABT6PU90_9PSEU|nr:hypothetical protein [Saccharopolyspora sp. TS4A08]MDI2031579.1 hypothetical protein [Saccharopolyspora sp. TS4A08]
MQVQDPNSTWLRIRECVREWRAALDYVEMVPGPVEPHLTRADEMEVEVVELLEGLITWLDKGGRPPCELTDDRAWPVRGLN